MKLLITTPEVSPLTKQSHNADQINRLALDLEQKGHSVTVFLPRYQWLDKKDPDITPLTRRIRLRLGVGTKEFNIYQTQLPDSLIQVNLIDKDLYFKRGNVFGDSDSVYPDHHERYQYFSLAVLESLKVLNYQPDVIVSIGSTTAATPIYLKRALSDQPFYRAISSLHVTQGNQPYDTCDQNTFTAIGFPDVLTFPSDEKQLNLNQAAIADAHDSLYVESSTQSEINVDEFIKSAQKAIETNKSLVIN